MSPKEIELSSIIEKDTDPFDHDSDHDSDSDVDGIPLLHSSLEDDLENDQHLEAGVRPFSSRNGTTFSSLSPTARTPRTRFGTACYLWRHKHWLSPDNPQQDWSIRWKNTRITLLDTASLKLLQFFVVTVACLATVHGYAAVVGDKRDVTYDWRNMVVYDGKPIVMDLMVFFVVGRLYENHSTCIDTLSFVVPLSGTAILQSWGATHLESLQHSITPYELKCEWTWQMYLLVLGGCLPLLGGLGVAYCREIYRRGTAIKTLVEFVASAIVFLVPYGVVSDGRFFHLHHWYYAWFLGMHCNLHGNWWSELAMSVLWGIYINGVAIFGRDPVLTCAQTLYQSQAQECPYLPFPEMAYGQYTLDDLARDSGIVSEVLQEDIPTSASEAIVCASDVTRWLSGITW